MNNEKLKIALCGYLPYGVKVQYDGILNGKERGEAYSEWKIRNQFKDFFDEEQLILPDEEIGLKVAPLKTITQYKKYWLAKAGIRQCKSFYNGNGFKPLLFSIKSLTKEIQLADYNNGLPFVPLKELHRLNELNEFSKNKDALRRIFVDTVISCEFMESDGSMFSSDYAQLKYTVDTNLGTLIYSFGYNATMSRFDARDESHKRPLGVAYQLEMFDLLNLWKIDYRGLINEGFAIEVNSENNPYL